MRNKLNKLPGMRVIDMNRLRHLVKMGLDNKIIAERLGVTADCICALKKEISSKQTET